MARHRGLAGLRAVARRVGRARCDRSARRCRDRTVAHLAARAAQRLPGTGPAVAGPVPAARLACRRRRAGLAGRALPHRSGERPARHRGRPQSRCARTSCGARCSPRSSAALGSASISVAARPGSNLTVVPESLPHVWWRIPVLVLSALQNATLEEVLVVGYLLHRLQAARLERQQGAADERHPSRQLPPLPGPRRLRGQLRHGADLRPALPAMGPSDAAVDRSHADGRGGVRWLRRARGPRLVDPDSDALVPGLGACGERRLVWTRITQNTVPTGSFITTQVWMRSTSVAPSATSRATSASMSSVSMSRWTRGSSLPTRLDI